MIEIWRKFGEYVKWIYFILVVGFGEWMDLVLGIFYFLLYVGLDGSWQGYVQYNINSLGEYDFLIELGVLIKVELKRVRQWFECLKMEMFCFGLCYGDFLLKNMMVDLVG